MTLNIDGQLWTVVDFQHVKPGKGGAFVRTKLKNVLSGKVVDRTFNAGVKVETASVDKREMQYLYREGEDFVFMDTQDYDQPRIPAATVGDAANYLLEEQMAVVAFNNGVPLHGRHQAGHPGDRGAGPRAAVHHDRREGQGGHPHRRVSRPGVTSRRACA